MVLRMKAYIIDREVGNISEKAVSNDLEQYVQGLLANIEKSKGLSQYETENPKIGVIATTLESVKRCCHEIDEKDEDTIAQNFHAVAFRFLRKETDAQERVEPMRTIIKVGCLVQAIIKNDIGYQYLIAKVDSTEYLNNFDLKRNRGIEISEKRLGKSCLINISENDDGTLTVSQIRILLDNKASYFPKEFLEVTPTYRDDHNTKRMMATVLKCIDDNLKKTYPRHRLVLRNAFIHHVRSHDFINYNDICTEVFNKYLDSAECEVKLEDKEKCKSSLEALPERKKFSPQFNKAPKEVKARIFQSAYKLNEGVHLVISDVEQDKLLKDVQSGAEPGGRQYIKVYTTDEEAIATFAPEEAEK